MEYIIILVVFLIIVFGLYKLCTYLNKDNTNRKNRINNVILKAGVVYILIFILLIIKFGLHGYYNGGRNPACLSFAGTFCYSFGVLGFVFNIFNYLWFGIILFILFLLYIIIYKIKYKKKIFKNKLIYLGEAIAIIIVSLFLYISNTNFKYFINFFNDGLLVSYDYEITTDLIYRTTSNDGGSYHNEYYLVSFTEGKIEKYEDVYIGFQGFKYKDRFLYQKDIPDDMKNELKTLLDRLVIEEDVNDDNNYSPYVINDNNQEKRIYNSESIRLLEDIFNRIDSLQ